MRTLAEQGRLTSRQARKLLDATDQLPWWDTEEFYKSAEAVASSHVTAPALVDFVQERLLPRLRNQEQNRPDPYEWKWLTFTAIGAILQRKTAPIPAELKANLQQEVRRGLIDSWRQSQLEDIVRELP
jgi:hypothetical protein